MPRHEWLDDLWKDEQALLGRDDVTDMLLYRLAWERYMRHLPEEEEVAEPQPELSANELNWISARLQDPDFLADEAKRKECHEKGGHFWGPVHVDELFGRPWVTCTFCGTSMSAHQLTISP